MNAALAYLERFAASRQMLEAVLMRKVDRAARAGAIERAEGAAMVAKAVERCVASGLIDDRVFAAARAETLLRQGKSPARIKMALAQKGVDGELVDAAVEGLVEAHGDIGLEAAIRLARRRRLGPFRPGERAAFRDKDLAVLARAGHGYDIAKRVIDAADEEIA
jgi:regulatory protein